METSPLLWVDLRRQVSASTTLCGLIPPIYRFRYVREPVEIRQVVNLTRPAAACFEYDEPGPEQLTPLRQTRLEFPAIPVLMLTVKHSEELAVWALRMRVWDYLVLPVDRMNLAARIAMLVGSNAMKSSREAILTGELPNGTPSSLGGIGSAEGHQRLRPALAYLEENYSEKVALGVVARLCGLGRYQFSRIFRRVHGTTFREFVITHRIKKAIHMLGVPGASITNVAFAVGFNDLSHFAQMFRRYVGVCPSDYLNQMKAIRR